jgi:hypothetical protein
MTRIRQIKHRFVGIFRENRLNSYSIEKFDFDWKSFFSLKKTILGYKKPKFNAIKLLKI